MRRKKPLIAARSHRPLGGAVVRLMLGVLSALLLLAAPLCIAQAQTADCESMMMMPMDDGGDHGAHHDQGTPSAKPDCTVGCRVAPTFGASFPAPVRVVYEIQFETELRTLAGIVIDPAVPPPRWSV